MRKGGLQLALGVLLCHALAAWALPPTVALTLPANGSTYATPAAFVVSASAADPDGTVTKVEFYAGTALVATVTAPPYAVSLSTNTPGTYTLTAKAYDNAGETGTSTAVTIGVLAADAANPPPSVALSWPAPNATYVAPANVPILAVAADNGTINRVEFNINGGIFASDPAAPYGGVVSFSTPGTYTITARAFDNQGASTLSAPVTISVLAPNASNAPPSVAVITPVNNATYLVGDQFGINAAASDTAGGSINRVEFYIGGALAGYRTSAPYSAGVVSFNTAGAYAVTAVAYDNQGAATAASANVVVRAPDPTNSAPSITLTAPANNAVYQAPGSVPVSATAADANGTVNRVEFYSNGAYLGIITASPYSGVANNLPAGTYAFSARAFDNLGASTSSTAATVVVNAPPSVSLTAPINGTVLAPLGTVALTATASDTDGTIAKVEFYRATTLIATVTGAAYTYTDSGLAPGTYSYTAKAYDNNGGLATSTAVSVRVNAPPSVAISAPASGTVVAPPGSIVVTVTASDTDSAITKVELYRGGTLIATLASAPYTYTDSGLATGSYAYTAKAYDSDAGVTTSAVVSVRVNAPPSVAITAPASGTVLPSPASPALSVTGSDPDGTIAKVELYRGATLIATLTAAPYTFTDNGLAAGSYSYTAKAYDNNGAVSTSTAVALTVNALPSVAITAPATGTVLPPPGSVALTVSASDSDGTISKVELYRGGTLIASLASAPYTYTDSGLASGSYSYTAKAYDNSNGVTTSAAVGVVVNALPSVAITAPAGGTVVQPPGTIALTAAASDADGTIAKVELYRGAVLIATRTATPYSYMDTGVASGAYSYTAKAYDNNGGVTTSAAVSVRVNAVPSVAITAPTVGTVLPPPGSVTITASASDSDGTIAKVELYRGATLIARLTAAPYTFTDSALASGGYSYTAKAYDNDGAVSTSPAMVLTVNALPTVAITAPAAGTVLPPPGSVSLTAAAADTDGTITKVELYRGAALTAAPYTYTDSGLAAGSYSYTAKAYDNNSAVSTSAALPVRVNALPSVAITAPTGGTVLAWPTSVALAATASDSDGTIAKVELYRGTALVATLATAPYSFTDSGLAVGTYSYTAKAYDNNGGVSTSAAVGLTVNALPTVAISAPAAGTVVAPPGRVTLTATASDSDGTIAKVELYRGATPIATLTTAPYTYMDNGLASGSYSYTAKAYDNLGGTRISAAVSVRVNALPNVAITTPTAGTVLPPPGSTAVTASASDSDGTITKVELYRATTLIATLTAAPYTFTDSALASGSYSYSAKAYDNDGGMSASTAVVLAVNALPTVTLTAPAPGAVLPAPASVALTASASDSDGTIAKVELYRGSALIATLTNAPYTYTDGGLASGSYSYSAKAYDNRGAVSSSAPVNITVNALPTVAITAPLGGSVVQAPGSFTVTASASDGDGTIAKVEFYRGAVLIATSTSTPFSVAQSNLAAGTYSYSAKAYDNNGGVTSSALVAVVVNAAPTVALTAPPTNSVLPASAALTLTAAASDADGNVVRVEFYNGATLLGQATAAPFRWSLTNLPAGPYAFYARAVDDAGGASLSAPVYVTVSGSATPTTVNYQYDELGRLIGVQPQ